MALKKFMVADQVTGMGGEYCKVIMITPVYQSNLRYTDLNSKGWKDVTFWLWVWKDRQAYVNDMEDIKELRFFLVIPASLLEGVPIKNDNEETLRLCYPILKTTEKLAGAEDILEDIPAADATA